MCNSLTPRLSLASLVVAALAMGAGCSDSDYGLPPATGGLGGLPGTGGAAPGTGGAVPGTGGMAPGTGGVAQGTGGEMPGSGGIPIGGTGGIPIGGTGGIPTGGTGGIPTGGTGGIPTGGTGGVDPGTGGEQPGQGDWGIEENPSAGCTVGAMPNVGSLTANAKLPDPFTKMDNTRMTTKDEWLCRREEILQQGYEFIYGIKPVPPSGTVSGTVNNNSISVQVNDGGSTSFTVTVSLPGTGSPPYPAVIAYGMNGFSGELASRGIASITYNVDSTGVENGGTGPKQGGFYDVYGSNHPAGLNVAWAWGVSRIIDVIEQNPGTIDPQRIGVTGCSRWGKGAFVAGVLDNRVALTVPVESGIGGTVALRLVEVLDSYSGSEWPYHAMSYQRWFSETQLGQFTSGNNAGADNTDRLPVDMHEMMALIAPRGLYIVDNPSGTYNGLDRNAAWVTANVAKEIFTALGVPDHITYQGASGTHCQWRQQYTAPLVANLQKFLLGDGTATTGSFATDLGNPPNPSNHYDWTTPNLSGTL